MEQYPVNVYYRDQIAAATTIKLTPRTWVAALLIKDPKTNLEFVRIYQWSRSSSEGEWKRRGVITLDRAEQVRTLISSLQSFAHAVADAQLSKLQRKTAKRAQAVLEKL
jgi:hypothetical protein